MSIRVVKDWMELQREWHFAAACAPVHVSPFGKAP